MALATLGNVCVFSGLVSSSTFSLYGSSNRITGQMKPLAVWQQSVRTSCIGLLPTEAFPSPLLPPAVTNSLSKSPLALLSCSRKLRELSQGFGHGVGVLSWPPAARRSGVGSVRSMAKDKAGSGQLEDLINSKNQLNAVVVYSKTWCPYCGMVKSLFKKLGVAYMPVELDALADEQDVQAALQKISGQTTVPNVFIGGKHIGGCDDTMALHSKGELIPLLKAAGAKFTPV